MVNRRGSLAAWAWRSWQGRVSAWGVRGLDSEVWDIILCIQACFVT
jgi:hypothetical protein